MNRALFIAMIFFFWQNCVSNPWTDDDYYYALFDRNESNYSHAIIRRQPVVAELETAFERNCINHFREPSKALLFFTGIAGIVFAGRHMRRK